MKNVLLPLLLFGALALVTAPSAEAIGPYIGPHHRHMVRRAALHQRIAPVRPVVAVYRAPIVYPVARPVVTPVVTPVVRPVVTPVVTHQVHYQTVVPTYQPVVYSSYYAY
jgi:hypothetical protein